METLRRVKGTYNLPILDKINNLVVVREPISEEELRKRIKEDNDKLYEGLYIKKI